MSTLDDPPGARAGAARATRILLIEDNDDAREALRMKLLGGGAMMASIWKCPSCGHEGPHLSAVFQVLHRDPVDPARDRVQCLCCGTQANRYDGYEEGGRDD